MALPLTVTLNLFFRKVKAVPSILLIFSAFSAMATERAGIRTNEPIYQNPFDLSSGGASLTRATQEGTIFANPSLPAFGPGIFRWIFFRTAVHVGEDAADLAIKTLTQQAPPAPDEIMDKAFETPVHAGLDVAAGVITSSVSGGAFSSMRVDFSGRKFGSVGAPELRGLAQGYGGAIASAAADLGDVLAIGGAVRYQANAEINESLGVITLLDNPNIIGDMQDSLAWGTGVGVDLGATGQLRTRWFDLRLAGTVNDLGQTKFTLNLPPWKQTINAGVGITIHSRNSALHCAVDLRDLQKAYGEHWTYRTYAGCKLLLNAWVGLGAGLYQGWPTYGFVLNLWLIRLEGGLYAKEVGKEVGTERRGVYFIALGTELP